VTSYPASINRYRRRLLLVASFRQIDFAKLGNCLGCSRFTLRRGFILAKFRFRKDPCRRNTRLFDRQLAEGSNCNFSKRGVAASRAIDCNKRLRTRRAYADAEKRLRTLWMETLLQTGLLEAIDYGSLDTPLKSTIISMRGGTSL
jgi:hypothetical protein